MDLYDSRVYLYRAAKKKLLRMILNIQLLISVYFGELSVTKKIIITKVVENVVFYKLVGT